MADPGRPPRALASALTLVLLTALLPELFSGATPAPKMVAGGLVLYLFAYGLPILALRDIAARTGAGWGGIFVMGLGYGLVNEGLYARTIFRATGSPLPPFDGQTLIAGINPGFTLFILCWHALSSVVLPIALTEGLWQQGAAPRRPWLGRNTLIGVALVAILAASGFFAVMGQAMADQGIRPNASDPLAFAALWLAIAALVTLGARVGPRPAAGKGRPRLAAPLGLAGLLPFILTLLPFQTGVPQGLSLALMLAGFLAYAWAIARVTQGRTRLIGLFGCGWYAMMVGFSAVHLVGVSPLSVIVNILLLGAVLIIAARAKDPA